MLEQKGVKAQVVDYMQHPLSAGELKDLLKKLGLKAHELVRTKEELYKEQFAGKTLSETQWIEAMIEHPKLMSRPIVAKGNKAVLGRPPENALALLK